MNGSTSLFVLKHGSSHPLPLPLRHWPPTRAEAHPRDRTTNKGEGQQGENKALRPCEKLILEKGVDSKAVPVRELKKHQESRTKAKITRLQWSSRACLRLHAYVGFHIYISRREIGALFIKIMGLLRS